MENIHYISSDLLSIEMINEIVFQGKQLALSEEAIVNIEKCRKYLDDKMKSNSDPIYGINTGFGSLCNVKISNETNQMLETSQLYYDQKNEWFFTEKPFKYYDEAGGYLEGPGVDFSKDFKIFNMQRSNGEVNTID